MTASPLDKRLDKPLKRSQASLFGGMACGIGAFVLAVLLAGVNPLGIAIGLIVGIALGVWVRLADL